MKSRKNNSAVVMRFELGNYLRSRSFLVSTLITCIVIALALSFPRLMDLFQGKAGPKKNIYIVNLSDLPASADDALDKMSKYKLIDGEPDLLDKSEEILAKPITEGIFVIDSEHSFRWYTERRKYAEYPEESLSKVYSKKLLYTRLLLSGSTEDFAKSVVAEPDVEIIEEASLSGKSMQQTQATTYGLVMLLYVCLLSYGQMTAVSVASEKGNRAMELLITSTDARSLINGKVFGTGLAGLLQLCIFGLVYFVFYFINRGAFEQLGLLDSVQMPPTTFGMAIIIFVICYLSFAYIYSALGSLVSRSEDVNQVVSPLSLIFIAMVAATILATFTPDPAWVKILSFVPLIGPLLLFVRFSMLSLPAWEFFVPMLIHCLAVGAISRLAVAIYRRGTLLYGKAPQIKDIFHLLCQKETTAASVKK